MKNLILFTVWFVAAFCVIVGGTLAVGYLSDSWCLTGLAAFGIGAGMCKWLESIDK